MDTSQILAPNLKRRHQRRLTRVRIRSGLFYQVSSDLSKFGVWHGEAVVFVGLQRGRLLLAVLVDAADAAVRFNVEPAHIVGFEL